MRPFSYKKLNRYEWALNTEKHINDFFFTMGQNLESAEDASRASSSASARGPRPANGEEEDDDFGLIANDDSDQSSRRVSLPTMEEFKKLKKRHAVEITSEVKRENSATGKLALHVQTYLLY